MDINGVASSGQRKNTHVLSPVCIIYDVIAKCLYVFDFTVVAPNKKCGGFNITIYAI